MTEDVTDLPPSAKYCLHILAERGPMTRSELYHATDLARSTVDFALRRLEAADKVDRDPDDDDDRRVQLSAPFPKYPR